MAKDTHNFVQQYKGLGAFGLDRETDEETVMFYLQITSFIFQTQKEAERGPI